MKSTNIVRRLFVFSQSSIFRATRRQARGYTSHPARGKSHKGELNEIINKSTNSLIKDQTHSRAYNARLHPREGVSTKGEINETINNSTNPLIKLMKSVNFSCKKEAKGARTHTT